MISVLFTLTTVAEFTQHYASLTFLVTSMENERKIRFEYFLCIPCALGAKLPCQFITR